MKAEKRAARDLVAGRKLAATCVELAERLGIEPPVAPRVRTRDPLVRAMLQRESLADWLWGAVESMARQSEALAAELTALKVEKSVARARTRKAKARKAASAKSESEV